MLSCSSQYFYRFDMGWTDDASSITIQVKLMQNQYISDFIRLFGSSPQMCAYAPGRINLIGEHTDYNLGYVLPAAINLGITCLFSPRSDEKIVLWAADFQEKFTFSLSDIGKKPSHTWSDYIEGMIWILQQYEYSCTGLEVYITGDVPLEAGLSSSAALEMSVVTGLDALYNWNISPMEMAQMGQKAENDFVGVKCGLMDQFISVFGQKNRALFLDCLTLEYREVPIDLAAQNLCILVYNSRVKRELAASAYNLRREEAQSALEGLKSQGIGNFREASVQQLDILHSKMGEVPYKRARHVTDENQRVLITVDALCTLDFEKVGRMLFESHESLRDFYEVSCEELDLLYECGRDFPGCLGARMIGGGFGGSGIALLRNDKTDAFIQKVKQTSRQRDFVEPEFYEIQIGEGAKAFNPTL